jgi:hypothetical protein
MKQKVTMAQKIKQKRPSRGQLMKGRSAWNRPKAGLRPMKATKWSRLTAPDKDAPPRWYVEL